MFVLRVFLRSSTRPRRRCGLPGCTGPSRGSGRRSRCARGLRWRAAVCRPFSLWRSCSIRRTWTLGLSPTVSRPLRLIARIRSWIRASRIRGALIAEGCTPRVPDCRTASKPGRLVCFRTSSGEAGWARRASGVSWIGMVGRYRGGSRNARAAMIDARELCPVLRRKALVRHLVGSRLNMCLPRKRCLLRRRPRRHTARTAVVGNRGAIVHNNRAAIHIGHMHNVDVRYGAIVEKSTSPPFPAEKSHSGVSETVVDPPVIADLRPPVPRVIHILSVVPGPVRWGPQEPGRGWLHPHSGNPEISVVAVGPIPWRPKISVARAHRLRVDRQHRRRKPHGDEHGGSRLLHRDHSEGQSKRGKKKTLAKGAVKRKCRHKALSALEIGCACRKGGIGHLNTGPMPMFLCSKPSFGEEPGRYRERCTPHRRLAPIWGKAIAVPPAARAPWQSRSAPRGKPMKEDVRS